ncbi:BamA/TamA family outer membrane protein [Hymenobacter humi]
MEVSGNVASALGNAFGMSQNSEGRYTVFKQPFSQYTKFDLELREYYRISADPASGNRIVARLQAGIGLPYGNSRDRSLPYLRQYGIGGPNSVRAFAPREIGPGTYKPVQNTDNVISYYDQVGDIRLEGNVEYRQDLVPYLKGAVFVDAGNIWLVNPDPDRPGGQFKASNIFNQARRGRRRGFARRRAVLRHPLRLRHSPGRPLRHAHQHRRPAQPGHRLPLLTLGLMKNEE